MMKEITLNNLFCDFSQTTENLLRLSDELCSETTKKESIKDKILSNEDLHETLTTVGVVLGGNIYKKVSCDKPCSGAFYLDVKDYIEPIPAFMLDSKLSKNDKEIT